MTAMTSFVCSTDPTQLPRLRPGRGVARLATFRALLVPLVLGVCLAACLRSEDPPAPEGAGNGFADKAGEMGPRGGKALGDIAANPDPLDGGTALGPMVPSGGTAGRAVMKFCHALTLDNHPVDLTVVVGGVRISARTGECSSLPALPCTSVPAGSHTLTLFHNDQKLHEGQMTLVPDGQYFTYANLVERRVTLFGGGFSPGSTCAAADIEDVFRGGIGDATPSPKPDGGARPTAPDAGPDASMDMGSVTDAAADAQPELSPEAGAPVDAVSPPDAGPEVAPPTADTATIRFCSVNPPTSSDNGIFDLSLAGQTFTAGKGACAPASGQPCAVVPAGTHMPGLTLDGATIAVAPIRLAAGREYVLVPRIQQGVPFVGVSPVERFGAGATCTNRTWANVFAGGLPPVENPGGVYPVGMPGPPPAGGGGGGGAAAAPSGF